MATDFEGRLAQGLLEMADGSSVRTTLERAVAMCVDALEHCDMAGISVAEKDRVHTLVASSEELRLIDDLQFELREGPCFDALRKEETVTANDLATDDRWPRWGALVSERVGAHASMSFRLFTSGHVLGVLNAYSQKPGAFTHDDLVNGYVVAAHAATALAHSLELAQLHEALESRGMIGQAIGILMERFGLDSEAAMGVLRRLSQAHNVKLSSLAQDLVEHGSLQGIGPRPPQES